MASLPHDVVESILERLPVNSLLRFKAVSKQWKSTIESSLFQERQLKQRERSRAPDVLMVSICPEYIPYPIESLRTFVLGSSSSVKIPTPWEKENTKYLVSCNSCDGLVCLYYPYKSGFVVNPATRWYRPLPLCQYQQLLIDFSNRYYDLYHTSFALGFGKDKFTGTYKTVWLYNSSELGLENATTCEVFDFSTNAWRYVTPAAPTRVVGCPGAVLVDGSLHWLTDSQETEIVSFDLRTETFQVSCKAPTIFVNSHLGDLVMCNLDNRLCVSQTAWPNQVIWSFNSDNKTWDKMCSFVHNVKFGSYMCLLLPLALFHGEKKKKMLLFYDIVLGGRLVTYDLETKAYLAAFSGKFPRDFVCYSQSLISIE